MHRRLASLALLLALGGAARADGAPTPPPGLVDGPTARALVASGVRVVDVRTPQEFAAGHVAGALNIPFDEIGRRAAEIGPPGTPVLLYCRTGRRSGIAAETLRRAGYERLWDLQRYDAWVASAPGGGQ